MHGATKVSSRSGIREGVHHCRMTFLQTVLPHMDLLRFIRLSSLQYAPVCKDWFDGWCWLHWRVCLGDQWNRTYSDWWMLSHVAYGNVSLAYGNIWDEVLTRALYPKLSRGYGTSLCGLYELDLLFSLLNYIAMKPYGDVWWHLCMEDCVVWGTCVANDRLQVEGEGVSLWYQSRAKYEPLQGLRMCVCVGVGSCGDAAVTASWVDIMRSFQCEMHFIFLGRKMAQQIKYLQNETYKMIINLH